MLPKMKYASGIRKYQSVQFGGLNRSRPDQDGRVWEMRNLSSDQYPLISARKPRYTTERFRLEEPYGIYGRNGLYYVDCETFCADGIGRCRVSRAPKTFAAMGTKIIILPDKLIYDTADGNAYGMEAEYTAQCTIQDGIIWGEDAEANTILSREGDWAEHGFKAGDAVTITGAAKHPENNQTIIVREVDGTHLRFYENSFTIDEGGDPERLTVKRAVPDLDFVFESENRLWGCKGSTIYCSKLGDPTNWNVFDGLSTDSWTAEVGSGGSFTGACSYLGYPMFFKEEQIYKVYGEKVSAYQVMNTASMGVERGSGKSLAVAGETLFYLSRAGFVAYTGGVPKNIHWPFGEQRFKNAVAGSDGTKYYVSAQTEDGAYELWVYDTRYGAWHREDETQAIGFAWNEELYCLSSDGQIRINGDARQIPEGATQEAAVESMVEFGDFTGNGNPNMKGTGKLQIRVELEEGTELRVLMKFDGGEWMRVAELKNNTGKVSKYLPIIPRRSDHYRIRFEAKGEWTLCSLVREEYTGSER